MLFKKSLPDLGKRDRIGNAIFCICFYWSQYGAGAGAAVRLGAARKSGGSATLIIIKLIFYICDIFLTLFFLTIYCITMLYLLYCVTEVDGSPSEFTSRGNRGRDVFFYYFHVNSRKL